MKKNFEHTKSNKYDDNRNKGTKQNTNSRDKNSRDKKSRDKKSRDKNNIDKNSRDKNNIDKNSRDKNNIGKNNIDKNNIDKNSRNTNSKATNIKAANIRNTNSKNTNGGDTDTGIIAGKQCWKPGNMLYPIPAVMVSCMDDKGRKDIITVAWTGNICSDPPMLSVSIRPERYSYDIIRRSGEFVVNLSTARLTKAIDWCGVKSGRDCDKFEEMKLTPVPSNKVKAPGIAQSPVNIECVVKDCIKLGSHDMFIAEVVCIDVASRYIDNKNRLDLKKAGLITYSHGEYFELGRQLGKFGYSIASTNKNH